MPFLFVKFNFPTIENVVYNCIQYVQVSQYAWKERFLPSAIVP